VKNVNKKCLHAWPIALIFVVTLTVTSTVQADCYDKRKPGMDWSGCKKTNKMLNRQNFTESDFDDTNFSKSNLERSNFTNASMVKTEFTRASLNHADFTGADMTKSAGYRASFDNAIFAKTIMTKSEYFRASFQGAKFSHTDMSRAEMGRADFTDAELSNVSFEFTNLARAIFKGSKLVNVNFRGAYTFLTRFEDVDLREVARISQLQLELACGNEGTQLPDGLEKPDRWPCEDL
jgi:uncharacterized protein YjbI with pentapeptide repeats